MKGSVIMLKRSLETQKTPDVQKTTDVEEGPSHRRQRIQSPEIHPIGEPPKDVQMGRKIGAMASPDYMPVSRDQTPTDSRDQTPKPPETPKEVITDKSRMFEFAYNTAET